jgi:hypothetical protein
VVGRLVKGQCDQDPGRRSCAGRDQEGCGLDPVKRPVATAGVVTVKVPRARHASPVAWKLPCEQLWARSLSDS